MTSNNVLWNNQSVYNQYISENITNNNPQRAGSSNTNIDLRLMTVLFKPTQQHSEGQQSEGQQPDQKVSFQTKTMLIMVENAVTTPKKIWACLIKSDLDISESKLPSPVRELSNSEHSVREPFPVTSNQRDLLLMMAYNQHDSIKTLYTLDDSELSPTSLNDLLKDDISGATL